MGSTTSPVLAHTGSTDLDQIPLVGHIKRVTINNIVFNSPTVTLYSDA